MVLSIGLEYFIVCVEFLLHLVHAFHVICQVLNLLLKEGLVSSMLLRDLFQLVDLPVSGGQLKLVALLLPQNELHHGREHTLKSFHNSSQDFFNGLGHLKSVSKYPRFDSLRINAL